MRRSSCRRSRDRARAVNVPAPARPADWPDRVTCYGCGDSYSPSDPGASLRHTRHAGDGVLSRETLLNWLDTMQRERDQLAANITRATARLAQWLS